VLYFRLRFRDELVADGACVDYFFGGGLVGKEGYEGVVDRVLVFAIVLERMEHADFAETLEDAEDFSSLGEASRCWVELDVDGACCQRPCGNSQVAFHCA